MSYIGTYYAIGSVRILILANYVDSFKMHFSIVIVLPGFGDRLLATLRYRTEGCSLIGAFFENLTWLHLGPCQPSHRVPYAQHRHVVERDKQRGGEHDVFGRGAADSEKIQVHDCILFCRDYRYDGIEWSRAS